MHTAIRLSATALASALAFVAPQVSAAAPTFHLDDSSLAVFVKDDSDPDDKKKQVKYGIEVRGAIIQNTAQGDAVRADFKKGGKTIASARCVIDQRGDEFRCRTKDDQHLTATGPIDVALTYLQDSTDKEFPLRTLHIKVLDVKEKWIQNKTRSVARLDAGGVQGIAIAYFDGHDSLIGDLTFEFWRSDRADGGKTLTDEDIRCSVNGKRIPATLRYSINHDGDEVDGKDASLYRYKVGFINVARIEAAKNKNDQIRLDARGATDYVQTNQFPGDWACQYRGEGQVAREFRFKVNADGTLAPHAEQTGPDPVRLPRGVILLEQSFGNPAKFNRGFSAAGIRAESFYGRPWSKAPATAAMLKNLEAK